MKPKQPSTSPLICPKGTLPNWVTSVVGDGRILRSSKIWFVYLGADTAWTTFSGTHPIPWEHDSPSQAVVILYDQCPISSSVLLSWQRAIEGYSLRAFRLLTRPPWLTDGKMLESWFRGEVAPLLNDDKVSPEAEGLKLGQYVQLTSGAAHSDTETEFLTLTFGPMQQAVELLETRRRRYLSTVRVEEITRQRFHKTLAPAFAIKPSKGDDPAEHAIANYLAALKDTRLDSIRPDSIPRILITGETGVGKTLIARNLTRADNGARLPYIRVSVPEFAGKEEDFESEMFGFRGGAYTGAPDDGSLGILLKHIGGVVFLDEIGDATPTMQAKLLAYLDDFKVRPRGFLTSLFAPTLIIAATNYDLDAKVKFGDFRQDLLMRFPVRKRIPSLNERKDWLPLILDTLLQSEKVNPGQAITDIGRVALSQLTQYDYTDGNFRMLENTFTEAIERARRQGRPFLVAGDISG